MIARQTLLSRNAQNGVGMIEVLIAILLLSIGILGIAALQMKAISNNSSAMSRSAATINMYSILDAMRADRNNAINGQYNVTMPDPITDANCTQGGTSLANRQINAWRQQLQQNMGPTACGSINCNSATETCVITIRYDDSRASGGLATQDIITEVVL
jgi:type IV pilus assembly protein PilV